MRLGERIATQPEVREAGGTAPKPLAVDAGWHKVERVEGAVRGSHVVHGIVARRMGKSLWVLSIPKLG